MNTLQSYIIITTYLCIYLYIQQKLISPTQQDLMLQKYISKSTRLKIEYKKNIVVNIMQIQFAIAEHAKRMSNQQIRICEAQTYLGNFTSIDQRGIYST